MRINVTARGTKVQENFHNILENKLARFDRFFDEDVTADVIVTELGRKERVEITIHSAGMVFRSEQVAATRQDALDACVDALFRQITRHKDKLSTRLQRDAFDFKKDMNNHLVSEYLAAESQPEEDPYEIVRTKRFLLKPMTPEEAILQMDLIGHQFFMFLSAETDLVSVIYRRDDGKFGLIEPEDPTF